ncbi:MAG: Ditrans,polycis-undecaprenyl-diphosphate synthase ((2E,6E)-farnesyl-diphosphate specific) [Ignavibacteria bacterium]|nr:Ditrans,polycis-undecaprenyl-diphosphate synthase ((2E,6E)-farnesyl-diphosphate specific) [Ignavibacteria bacterium]
MIEPSPKDKVKQDELKRSGEIPRHVAIIMDGNGRWAKSKKLSRVFGHNEGVNSARDIVEVSGQLGIKFLTLYTFSTENWKRPKSEVTLLMKLLIKSIRGETDRLNQNDVKLVATGNLNNLPEKVLAELNEAMEITKNNKLMTLNLALSYSGRWDIVNAINSILKEQIESKTYLGDMDEKKFSSYLVTKDIPDPDLLIRTGGEFRISNFLLWQLAYSEIYIDQHYWPDFKRAQFYKAISDFQKRERRFGLTSEQLNKDVKN